MVARPYEPADQPNPNGGNLRVRNLRIAVLIPDRGDRPELLENCLRMIAAQTLQPVEVYVVGVFCNIKTTNEYIKTSLAIEPIGGVCDITKRYRIGYNGLCEINCLRPFDLIALIENDDWYSPDYLERMAEQWVAAGEPDLFGTAYTMYYHVYQRGYFEFAHPDRASAMNTFIKPGLRIDWPADHDPYTDLSLWWNQGIASSTATSAGEVLLRDQHLTPHPNGIRTKATWHPLNTLGRHISIGMKHGIGLCGGYNHTNKLNRYKHSDADGLWLKHWLDADSYAFYRGLGDTPTNPLKVG